MNKNKKYAEWKSHCKKRCKERYGIEPSNKMLKFITEKARVGNGYCLGCGRKNGIKIRNRKVYVIKYEGAQYKIVYDVLHERLITFLPWILPTDIN